MSQFIDRLRYFKCIKGTFSQGLGETIAVNRDWENTYRQRWQQDKIVRSTHGVNCTGSCSWKIYVKNGLVTWETQHTDYPKTRPDLPNHEPRGCPRGASYSWYIYSANRIKYPMIRKELLVFYRQAKQKYTDPVQAWESIMNNPNVLSSYKKKRGRGGLVRTNWEEVNEIIAASTIYNIKVHGPDRIIGFSPIPAMSMVSYAAGSRFLSLLGGVNLSFYDWYCDLPPSSPQTWGEQTDVPESADWYNSSYLIAWGSNIPQTRTPDAHFFNEVRYKGTKTIAISPDYSEVSKFSDEWLAPKKGTDSALALAMGHVILNEFHFKHPSPYFTDYVRRYTDMPMLVILERDKQGHYLPGRLLRASDLDKKAGQRNNPEWKTIAIDDMTGAIVVPNGSAGFRWGEEGKWNLEEKEGRNQNCVRLRLSLIEDNDDVLDVGFPYFGRSLCQENNPNKGAALYHKLPAKIITTQNETTIYVTTVYDLILAHYGIDRGLNDSNTAQSYGQLKPYTPAWAEHITGVDQNRIVKIAREFAENADKTKGRSMIIVGAGINHWYHMDMTYRGLINMLIFCGCIGQSGGGWSHYVGQEKLRPQSGWLPIAFALDWLRPPRQMNSTSFFYLHSSQWRYERLSAHDLLSPLADKKKYSSYLIDFNVKAERLGWLPSAPQLNLNPLKLNAAAQKVGQDVIDYTLDNIRHHRIRFASETPDDPKNFPRQLFIWRSNLLGSSGKGHEYLLRYLLGIDSGIQDIGDEVERNNRPGEVEWQEEPAIGKLDLLITLDFRMSTTALYSDIVLPTATWYEKDDMNTSDMHPFIHPLTAAVDPAWDARTDWNIYRDLAKKFSELCSPHLGEEVDVVTHPLQHDSPGELGQPFEVKDWKTGECKLTPGKTAPNFIKVTRNYPQLYKQFISVGPLLERLGNGAKGITWNTQTEIAFLKQLNGTLKTEKEMDARMETARQACETILTLAPETNGNVAVKAWQALEISTGRPLVHLALHRKDDKIRFSDIIAQPRKIITSPIWSGIESDKVSYNAGYTNVHELIPWRTISGRQQLYQDHPWMRDFGEALPVYKCPVDTGSAQIMCNRKPNGNPEIVLNFITPHQKWGIHSTYSDNLRMLVLSRGGPVVWISEDDALLTGIKDNDWIEAYNINGALTARAIVSQRIPNGVAIMYHAQERIICIPGSEITGQRGGIHNSVTRIYPKPTHMIGGYAQLAYGFNYYGTVGSNRDEFVILRKMNKIDWLDDSRSYFQEKIK